MVGLYITAISFYALERFQSGMNLIYHVKSKNVNGVRFELLTHGTESVNRGRPVSGFFWHQIKNNSYQKNCP